MALQYEAFQLIDSISNGALVSGRAATGITKHAYLLSDHATDNGGQVTVAEVAGTGTYVISYDPAANGDAVIVLVFDAPVGSSSLAGDLNVMRVMKKDPVAQGYIPGSTAGASGGLLIDGSNAALVTFAAGVVIGQSTTNGTALTITGNGSGEGVTITGGGNTGSLVGAGMSITGGSNTTYAAGHGLKITGGGITGAASLYSAGHALLLTGGATGSAGNTVTAGSGIVVAAPSTGGTTPTGAPAVSLTGVLAGAGLSIAGGNTGNGISVVGGASSIKVTAPTGSGYAGIEIHGYGDSASVTANAIFCSSNNADAVKLVVTTSSGHGLSCTGNGASKAGLYTTGTAYGMYNYGPVGQYNQATSTYAMQNAGGTVGTYNSGSSYGNQNYATSGTGQYNQGGGGQGMYCLGSSGSAGLKIAGTAAEGVTILAGTGAFAGMSITGGPNTSGTAGTGLLITGGAASSGASLTSGDAVKLVAGASSGSGTPIGGVGINIAGTLAKAGVSITGGATGAGLTVAAVGGNANAVTLTGNGTGKDLSLATAGTVFPNGILSIGSWSTYAGGDTPGTTTMLANYARRTGDYSTYTGLTTDQTNIIAGTGIALNVDMLVPANTISTGDPGGLAITPPFTF